MIDGSILERIVWRATARLHPLLTRSGVAWTAPVRVASFVPSDLICTAKTGTRGRGIGANGTEEWDFWRKLIPTTIAKLLLLGW